MRAIRTLPRITILAFAITLVPAISSAQSTEANSEQAITDIKRPRSHRFLDSINLALTGLETTAMAADGFYTLRALRQYPDVFYEANPIARPFVSRGWPGMIAGGALFVSADLGIRYLLHRAGHHRIERWFPSLLISAHTYGTLHNREKIRAAERTFGSR